MKTRLIILTGFLMILGACGNLSDEQDHQDELKVRITAYSRSFELFAEADPFVVGKSTEILSHFSYLDNFKALESGSVTVHLKIKGKKVSQTLEEPTRKGIYKFEITPNMAGKGVLEFEISTKSGRDTVVYNDIEVFADSVAAREAAGAAAVNVPLGIVYTKEQSWKVEFATELPRREAFGPVIKTVAQVQPAQGDEVVISARMNGIVLFSSNTPLEGSSVNPGQSLFYVSGANLASNNSQVRYAEAKSNFDRAKANYDRISKLAVDKIVTEKELLTAKNDFETTEAIYNSVTRNFGTGGQSISSPMKGYVRQLLVANGQYVQEGQSLIAITQNKELVLKAEVQLKYSELLSDIVTANIRIPGKDLSYTLENLNGKLISCGRSANADNLMIPVSFQIDNVGDFIPGSFVDIFIKTRTNNHALTIPVEALYEEQGNFFVFVQINPELFEKRQVKIGGNDGIRVEIQSGIAAEERVVTHGVTMVHLASRSGSGQIGHGHAH